METVRRAKGKRKPSAPCETCLMSPAICMCSTLEPLSSRTRLLLVIHYAELRRTSNTGQLACAVLENSERITRGKSRERLDLSAHLSSDYQPLFLYPTEDATELSAEYVSTLKKPVQLIVPDGNWRQASKVHYRHHELSEVPRVFVRGVTDPRLRLRHETTELGMATLEAIAFAFGALESPEHQAKLLRLYQSKAERVLWSRGHLNASKCQLFVPDV